ncbi:MAG: hypothetical protein J6W09_04935 [Bacteroidales bacterium]|nr:hypothetical protein [Bacteroidales bacterium]
MKRLFIILTALFFAAPFLCAQETPPPEVVALLEEDPDRCAVNMHVCLACNLQMVFYRSRKGGPVLVKFLVNEKETLLRGLTPVQGPYYDWSLVRENIAGWQR